MGKEDQINEAIKAFPASSMKYQDLNGMDLRDYFAANVQIDFTDLDCVFNIHWDEYPGEELIKKLAQARYIYADAMMEARKK